MYIVSYRLKHSTRKKGAGDGNGGFDAMLIIVFIPNNYSNGMSYALMFQLLSCNIYK